jgi:hypothetical protein
MNLPHELRDMACRLTEAAKVCAVYADDAQKLEHSRDEVAGAYASLLIAHHDLEKRESALRAAAVLVLPMAESFVRVHQVGRNAEILQQYKDALHP